MEPNAEAQRLAFRNTVSEFLDFLNTSGHTLPRRVARGPRIPPTFTEAEDLRILSFALKPCNTMHMRRVSFFRQLYAEHFEHASPPRSVIDLQRRLAQLARPRHRLRLWHLVTGRCDDMSVDENSEDYANFKRVSETLAYYALPFEANRPDQPVEVVDLTFDDVEPAAPIEPEN